MTMDEMQTVITCVFLIMIASGFTIGSIAFCMIWLSFLYGNPKANKKQKEEKKNDEQ